MSGRSNMMNLGKESELLEFKETTNELDDSIIDIAAILNKHGRGILYFGVKNNGDAIGFDIGQDTQRDISRRIFEKLKPQIFPVIEEVPDSRIIKVTFEGNERPYSAFGRYYVRVSDESREMTPDELTRMIIEVNYKSWEKQKSEDTIDDVDEDQLAKFLDKAISCGRIGTVKYDKPGLLEHLGLLAADKFHLNNAGRFLFSNKGPIELKMAVFATNEKRTFIDISPIKGNIFSLIEESEKYIKKNIHWSVQIKGFDRTDVPEVPLDALREIIVNSFAHANYVGWSKNEIDIFPNRIAIYNPGAFPDGYNPEDFVNKAISSKVRNELICDALFRCKAIEKWGTGFSKTYSYCKKSNVKVGYEKEIDGFWFVFYRNNTNNGTNDVIDVISVANVTDTLSELEKAIIKEIEGNLRITKCEIAEKCGKSSRTVQRVLNSLKDKKIIERIGGTRGYWRISR